MHKDQIWLLGIVAKIQDFIDDGYANFWEGYIENLPKTLEKEVYTYPVTKPWSRAPELCEVMLAASMEGLMNTLNPKFESKRFSKLMPKGGQGLSFSSRNEGVKGQVPNTQDLQFILFSPYQLA